MSQFSLDGQVKHGPRLPLYFLADLQITVGGVFPPHKIRLNTTCVLAPVVLCNICITSQERLFPLLCFWSHMKQFFCLLLGTLALWQRCHMTKSRKDRSQFRSQIPANNLMKLPPCPPILFHIKYIRKTFHFHPNSVFSYVG